MILNEDLFEIYEEETEWSEVDSKSVPDAEGFLTDYTWYTNGKSHIFILGDNEIYTPDNTYIDWEIEIYPGQEDHAYKEAQDWFDNYAGLAESCLVSDDKTIKQTLTEEFSESLPKWLVRAILHDPAIKKRLLSRRLDLANLQYVNIPIAEMPTSGFHPLFKDDTKLIVYLLRDLRRNVVYFPGINDDDLLYTNPKELYKTEPIKYLSRKRLLDYTVLMGYIDLADDANKTFDKHAEREASRKGQITRGSGLYQKEYKTYAKDEHGWTDLNNYTSEWEWVMTRGQDKSGYPLNPTKYKDMLDQADLHTYGRQFERYTKKLELLREAIIEYVQSIDVTDGSQSRHYTISDVMRKFEDAMYDYKELLREIESIIKNADLTDDEKSEYIRKTFDGTRSYNYISSLRRKLEEAWQILKELKNTTIEEQLTYRNFDEFRLIAREVGLKTLHDIELFQQEEVQEGEDELTAIKRYKLELLDAGVNLSTLVNESIVQDDLNEGAVKDIALEIEECGGAEEFCKITEKRIQDIESEIDYLTTYAVREVGRGGAYDSKADIEEAVSELEDEMEELQSKLLLLKK